MLIRPATIADIPAMHAVRLAVRENVLSDPARVQERDYRTRLDGRGRGWVCEVNGEVVGFGIADQASRNIWALFVHPDFERRGIGRRLLRQMIEWLAGQPGGPVWLTTAPETRAAGLYRQAGWREAGRTDEGEIRFEWTP